MAERSVCVGHTTLNRWVVKYAPAIADAAQQRKSSTARSWRVDETYIKVKGTWTCLCRAVDRDRKTLDAAQATLAGIETAHMIRKGQLADKAQSPFQTFAALAG